MDLALPPGFGLADFVTEISPKDEMMAAERGSSERYIGVGLSALGIIEHTIHAGILCEPVTSILDLPCGHGRVGRVLRARFPFPAARMTVCDINRDGVDFCASRLNARGIYSSEDFTALDLGDRFDLIWVGSLLTHFPPSKTVEFIRCMGRHLSAEGAMMVTTHGQHIADEVRESASCAAAEEFDVRGYAFGGGDAEYGSSLISRAWLEGFFAGQDGLTLAAYHERGWDDRQDVFIATRRR